MLRDLAQVRAAAELVEADLRRLLGASWSCRVDDDWILTVSDGVRAEASLLSSEVEDDAWYVNPRWPVAEQRAALDADAAEAVASELIELLHVLGAEPLTCPVHGAELGSCEGVWYCGGAIGHDVAAVGHLGLDGPLEDVRDPGPPSGVPASPAGRAADSAIASAWARVARDCGCPDVYYCPAADEIECPRHSGFSTCCDRAEDHLAARAQAH